jgi:hypothetical protein
MACADSPTLNVACHAPPATRPNGRASIRQNRGTPEAYEARLWMLARVSTATGAFSGGLGVIKRLRPKNFLISAGPAAAAIHSSATRLAVD